MDGKKSQQIIPAYWFFFIFDPCNIAHIFSTCGLVKSARIFFEARKSVTYAIIIWTYLQTCKTIHMIIPYKHIIVYTIIPYKHIILRNYFWSQKKEDAKKRQVFTRDCTFTKTTPKMKKTQGTYLEMMNSPTIRVL